VNVDQGRFALTTSAESLHWKEMDALVPL